PGRWPGEDLLQPRPLETPLRTVGRPGRRAARGHRHHQQWPVFNLSRRPLAEPTLLEEPPMLYVQRTYTVPVYVVARKQQPDDPPGWVIGLMAIAILAAIAIICFAGSGKTSKPADPPAAVASEPSQRSER